MVQSVKRLNIGVTAAITAVTNGHEIKLRMIKVHVTKAKPVAKKKSRSGIYAMAQRRRAAARARAIARARAARLAQQQKFVAVGSFGCAVWHSAAAASGRAAHSSRAAYTAAVSQAGPVATAGPSGKPHSAQDPSYSAVSIPSRANASEIVPAVTPEPHDVTIGFCRSTFAPPKIAFSCSGDFMVASGLIRSVKGTFRLPGIWPERRPGHGSAAVPSKRSFARASTTCSVGLLTFVCICARVNGRGFHSGENDRRSDAV